MESQIIDYFITTTCTDEEQQRQEQRQDNDHDPDYEPALETLNDDEQSEIVD